MSSKVQMSPVSFKVNNIVEANKPGFVVAEIRFHGSEKVYTYIRQSYEGRKRFEKYFLVDGCRVYFDERTFDVNDIERQYETEGVKKFKSNVKRGAKKERQAPKRKYKKRFNVEVKEDDDDVIFELQTKAEKEIFQSDDEEAEEEKQVDDYEYNEDEVTKHEKYDIIAACIKNNIPVYLSGPAGSGKNHTLEQIAVDFGMNFYFSNAIQQEYKLTGFIDAGGKFHETEFYKACTDKKRCIFFLDEIDASIPEVLVLLNAAIANGYFEFPTGRVYLDHVCFVAAGNTVGSGADELYTGRSVIDQATLDRFAIIEFDYDKRIDLHLAKGNADLVAFVHGLRDEASRKGIRATFSYRCIIMIVKLERDKIDLATAIKICIVKGLDEGTLRTLQPQGSTKYHKAFDKIKSCIA